MSGRLLDQDTRRRLTADQLADIVGLPLGAMAAILEESERDGNVERCGGNFWRLTVGAERRFGRALRGLDLADDRRVAA